MIAATDRLAEAARAALIAGEEAALVDEVEQAARHSRDAKLWQWGGLLRRSLDEHTEAIAAFDQAARLAPQDASIAHGLARVRFEGGLDARDDYRRAIRLAPGDGDVMIGSFAARSAMGESAAVSDDLTDLLKRFPGWLAGHQQFAQLQALRGYPEGAPHSLDEALLRFPRDDALWQARLDLAVCAENFAALPTLLDVAEDSPLSAQVMALYAAIGTSETGALPAAEKYFESVPSELGSLWRLRFLLRAGRVDQALPLIEFMLAGPQRSETWAYAHLAWRLVGDERADWLLSKSVQTFDIADLLPPLDQVAALLTQLHGVSGQYLDQSVRGGTQTDGPLFSRLDPALRAVRGAVLDAVEQYRDSLAPFEPEHPLLGQRRDRPLRFAGSWSVRLRAKGNHANHVHPKGWISSALYIALPSKGSDRAGWLKLGEPQRSLGLELAPLSFIEPRLGRLVLFPSWLWHGTVPFEAGERLTIAFDIAPPK